MDTIQTIDKLKEVFEPIAEKIGQGAQFGWEVVMKQQYIVAVSDFIVLACCVVAIFIAKWLITQGQKSREDSRWNNYEFWYFGGIILLIVSAVLIPLCLYDGIAHLINPEYYALDFFINLAR